LDTTVGDGIELVGDGEQDALRRLGEASGVERFGFDIQGDAADGDRLEYGRFGIRQRQPLRLVEQHHRRTEGVVR